MYDLITIQHDNSWRRKLSGDGTLPDSIQFGLNLHEKVNLKKKMEKQKKDFQSYLKYIYQIIWENIVLLIGRF